MGKPPDRLGLLQKPLNKILTGNLILSQHFYGNQSFNLRVMRFVNDAHRTFSEFVNYLIATVIHVLGPVHKGGDGFKRNNKTD